MEPTLVFETTAEFRPGFPPLLWEAARDILGCVSRPVYHVYRSNLSSCVSEYDADVYVATSALGSAAPYVIQSHFVDSPEMALQVATWKCLARLRYFEATTEPPASRSFPPRSLASPSHPMVSIEVMLNSTLSHLEAYTTALESILAYHLEECHSNRQALARVPQPTDKSLVDTKLCLGPKPQDPDGNKVDAQTKSPASEES